MGVLNFLGDLGDAFYKPQLNAVGINAKGEPVDSEGNPTSLYSQPNWFERGFSPEAKQYQSASSAASAYPIAQAQQQLQEQRALIGKSGAQTAADIARANSFEGSPISTQSGLAGIGAMNPEALNTFYQNQAKLTGGTYPAMAGAATAEANTDIAAHPPAANPLIAQNVMRQQGVGVPYAELGSELRSLYPGIDSGSLMIGAINPATGGVSSVRNPISSLQSTLVGNYLNGMGGGTPTKTSSGNVYMRPQPQVSIPPIGATSGQVAQFQGGQGNPNLLVQPSGNLRPLYGTNYQVDDNGQLFTSDGRFMPEENIKGTPIEKALKHQLGLEKNIHNMRATHLPHGLGYELQKTIETPSPGYPTIQHLYHGLIGE